MKQGSSNRKVNEQAREVIASICSRYPTRASSS